MAKFDAASDQSNCIRWRSFLLNLKKSWNGRVFQKHEDNTKVTETVWKQIWSLLNVVLRRGIAGGLIVLSFMPLFFAQATPDSELEFELGHWGGKSEWSDLGEFESCMVSLHNEKNVLLILRLDRDYSLTVGLFEKLWENSGGSEFEVVAQADHSILYAGFGLLIDAETLTFQINNSTQSIQLLGSSRLLRVALENDEAVFDLADSDSAMSFLIECWEKGGKNTKCG